MVLPDICASRRLDVGKTRMWVCACHRVARLIFRESIGGVVLVVHSNTYRARTQVRTFALDPRPIAPTRNVVFNLISSERGAARAFLS